jgi:hypothetical protein
VNKEVVRRVDVILDYLCHPPPIITSPLLHIIILVVVVIIIIFIAERNCQARSIMLPFLWVQDSKLGPFKEFFVANRGLFLQISKSTAVISL